MTSELQVPGTSVARPEPPPRQGSRFNRILLAVVFGVILLGGLMFRDLSQAQANSRQNYARVLHGLELLGELQYQTQEARRTLLYALVTSDSNRQVEYADLSRAADENVARLLGECQPSVQAPVEIQATQKLALDWKAYLVLRDELIASMLEGRPKDAVERDLKESVPAFVVVRDDIKELEGLFKAEGNRMLDEIEFSFHRALVRTGIVLLLGLLCAFVVVKMLQKSELLNLARSTEAQLRRDLESISEELLVLDAGLRVHQWNDAAEKSWDRKRSFMLGQEVGVAFPEITRTPLASAIEAALQSGRASVLSDLRLQGNEGERVYQARVFPFQNRATVFLDNITEVRRSEATKARLTAILEATTDFVAMADADGAVTYVNRAGRLMLGMTEHTDVQTTRIPDYHPEWAARLIFNEALPAASRDGVWSGETAFLTKQGREVCISQVILSHKRPDGTVEYYSTIARDITERKQAELNLAEANKQLVEVSRQAGMADVATSVLHNVGNVLNSVNVAAGVVCHRLAKSRVRLLRKTVQLLQLHSSDLGSFFTSDVKGRVLPAFLDKLAKTLEEENQGLCKEMESVTHHVDHIKQIVATQQSYGRAFGLTETLDPRVVIEDAMRLNAESIARNGVVIERVFLSSRTMTADRHKVLQILVNLLRNARQAIAEANPTERRITLRLSDKAPARIAITVEDTGAGISQENLDKIFRHGFTTKKDGHGFGLHASVLAAREMKGDLTFQSQGPGRGAAFTLELPIAAHQP